MKRRATRSLAFALSVAALTLLDCGRTIAQVPPDENYRTFDTEHFRVIFPVSLEPFARQAAASAEWAYGALSSAFISPPGGRISLIIADNTDAPNASATPIPRNRVTLIATPDIGSRQLNYYTDWLDVTLAHELTHIFHLDRAAGLWPIGRAVFGRLPLLFPAFYQPRWVIEGLATYYESRLTGAGRAYGSFFPMLLTSAAEEGRLRTVDAGNGLTPNWPAGNPPYAYGGLYFKSLAEEHGDTAIADFVLRGAARFPYTVEWASTPVFGHKLSDLWDIWEADFKAEVVSRSDSIKKAEGVTNGRPLSEFAWRIPAPRFSPDGRHVVYTLIDPREDAATVVARVEDGSWVQRKRRNGSGTNAWSLDGSTVFLQQPEFKGRYRIYTDLWALDVESGQQRRLTKGARIGQHDLAPDGRTLIAVQVGNGTNRLVTFDLDSVVLTPLSEYVDSVNWQRPRWSPDGRYIAVGRWREGDILDIVVLDRDGELVGQITRDDAADVVPVWSPDGRYILWASDRAGVYNIYAADLSAGIATDGSLPPVSQVTRTIGGAQDPDISPDGRWLGYAALHADGYRVELIPYDPSAWQPAGPVRRQRRPHAYGARHQSEITAQQAPTRGYSPFPSIWPSSWLPIITTGGSAGTFIGASTAGTDDINRHAFGLLAGWRTGVEAPELGFAYFYRGFGQPTMRLTLSQEWSSFLATDDAGSSFTVNRRDRDATLAATFLRRRQQSAFAVTPAIGVEWVHFSTVDPSIQIQDPTFTDLEAELILGFSRARGYPRSVSLEKGYTAVLDLTHRRLADDFGRWNVSAQLLTIGYSSFALFGYANHVIAARLAVGASDGHNRNPEFFDLGGIPGRPFLVVPGVEIGGGADYPVRGFGEGVERGDRITSWSVEYRLPLVLVGRGYGLWPVLLNRLSASLFFDGGAAWNESDDNGGDDIDPIASTGVELSTVIGLAYSFNTTFRIGIARQIIVPAGASKDFSLYLAAGFAF